MGQSFDLAPNPRHCDKSPSHVAARLLHDSAVPQSKTLRPVKYLSRDMAKLILQRKDRERLTFNMLSAFSTLPLHENPSQRSGPAQSVRHSNAHMRFPAGLEHEG
jgi:hypothetical protein